MKQNNKEEVKWQVGGGGWKVTHGANSVQFFTIRYLTKLISACDWWLNIWWQKGISRLTKMYENVYILYVRKFLNLNKFVLYKLTLLIDLYLFVCQKWSVLWLVRGTISVLLLTWICEIFCCKFKHLYFDDANKL